MVIAITFIFLFISGRLFFVQVIKSDFYKAIAIDQWTRELPIKATRGEITDSSGVVLAGNKTAYTVFVRPRSVKNAAEVATILSGIFGLEKESLFEKIKSAKSSEITVAKKVSREKILELTAFSLDGVYYSTDNVRVYPFGEALCRILGYTSSDGVGQSGIEQYYEKYLCGVDGEILYEADLVGKDVEGKPPSYVPSVSGLSLRLNIDCEIQQIAEAAIAKAAKKYTPKGAAVVILEPSTSKVLAMAEYPSFDLNAPPRDDIDYLLSASRSGMISDSYEPGSTFKIITSAANIEEALKGNKNAIPLDHVYPNDRYRTVLGRKIKCWSTHANGKHANQTLREALNNSCNPCFVDIALSLGKETMYEYIKAFNFGKTTGIDFFGEASGMTVPLSSVTDGDIARISFGQTIAVTQLQLAAAACACVNGGVYNSPTIVGEINDPYGVAVETVLPKTTKRVISEKASSILAGYLEGVVRDGSGKQAYIEGYKVGGKTGTAQKYFNGAIAQGKYVMSFMGFFPSDKPKYLALLTVDEPVGGSYGSTVAAPLVREIFEGIIQAKNIKPFEEV